MPSAHAYPACAASQYSVYGQVNGASGAVVIGASIAARRGPPCDLKVKATLRITDGDGRQLKIEGEPVTERIDVHLADGRVTYDRVPDSYAWQNWCNEAANQYYYLVASVPGVPISRTSLGGSVPGCQSPSRPSFISAFTDHGPAPYSPSPFRVGFLVG
jgi:hypothetical protein